MLASLIAKMLGRGSRSAEADNRPKMAPQPLPQISSEKSETLSRHDRPVQELPDEFSDVSAGYQFIATLQLRTPLRILLEHGRIHADLNTPPPLLTDSAWQGIWIPKPKSFRELGLDMDELAEFPVASEVGPVLPSEYLPFLIAVRKVVEEPVQATERRSQLVKLLKSEASSDWVKKHGGQARLLDQFFPSFLDGLPYLSEAGRDALGASKIDTPSALLGLTDEELLRINGIGATRIEKLRAYASAQADPNDRYRDLVVK